jgi:hypothetical protein
MPSPARGEGKNFSSAARGDTRVAAFTSSLVKQPNSFPRRDCARVVEIESPPKGGRSADRRPGAAAPGWTHHDAVRPGACEAPCVPQRRDARLSALHRGGFWPGSRASVCGISSATRAASSSQPSRSAWRAGSRTSRGAVTSHSRRTPHLSPLSGSSLENALR